MTNNSRKLTDFKEKLKQDSTQYKLASEFGTRFKDNVIAIKDELSQLKDSTTKKEHFKQTAVISKSVLKDVLETYDNMTDELSSEMLKDKANMNTYAKGFGKALLEMGSKDATKREEAKSALKENGKEVIKSAFQTYGKKAIDKYASEFKIGAQAGRTLIAYDDLLEAKRNNDVAKTTEYEQEVKKWAKKTMNTFGKNFAENLISEVLQEAFKDERLALAPKIEEIVTSTNYYKNELLQRITSYLGDTVEELASSPKALTDYIVDKISNDASTQIVEAIEKVEGNPLTQEAPPLIQDESLPTHEGNPSIQDESLPTYEGNPSIQDESLPTHDDKPSIQDESLPIQDDKPSIQDESLPTQDDKPSIQDESLPIQDDKPSIQDESLPTHEGNPPTHEGNPPTQEGNPPTKDETLPIHEGNPPMQEVNLSTHEGNPPTKEDKPSLQDETLPIHEGNPPMQEVNLSTHEGNPSTKEDKPSLQDESLPTHEGDPPTREDNPSRKNGNIQTPNAQLNSESNGRSIGGSMMNEGVGLIDLEEKDDAVQFLEESLSNLREMMERGIGEIETLATTLNYEPVIELGQRVIVYFNDNFSQEISKGFEDWEAGEYSLEALMKAINSGEDAEENARNIQASLEAAIKDGLKGLDELSFKSSGDVTLNSDEFATQIRDIASNLKQSAESLSDTLIGKVTTKMQENDLWIGVNIVLQGALNVIQRNIELLSKDIDKLVEDHLEIRRSKKGDGVQLSTMDTLESEFESFLAGLDGIFGSK